MRKFQRVEFPLALETDCGLFMVDNCDSEFPPQIQFDVRGNLETVGGGGSIPPECSVIELPRSGTPQSDELFGLLSAEFIVEWNVSADCSQCHERGGQCLTNNMNQFRCKREKSRLKLILATSISGGAFLLLLCTFVSYIIWRRKKRINEGYFFLEAYLLIPPQIQTSNAKASTLYSLFSHTQNLKRPLIASILLKNSEMEALEPYTTSDAEVRRMTTSVAELAFGCLQLEKDLRPSMDEVLDFLINIQSGEDGKCDGTDNNTKS
ncbi:hypothetical protein BUALT_Bualt17G0101500 [Buddleja alternifolia]|uniref:Wall-associated receptor kinase C-terminal domain-containing protein n=1 Tax=Buddleja alternifolia TaxID=168488 RepID=A0AAV6W910_9LAMI|nr:hypothetical protein BUALT_Bualt17G0101500 [Buddleja alternifolia]